MSDHEPLIRPTMHHVNLKTTKLQEMIDWYGVVVGSKPNFQFPGGAFISNDRANHRIALLAVPGLKDDPRNSSHRHASYRLRVRVLRRPDVVVCASEKEGHRAAGMPQPRTDDIDVLFRSRPEHGRATGRQFGNWEASAEWMRTAEDFRRDPIGSVFDPDDVLAAYQAGATFEQLQTDTRKGKYPPKKPPNLNLPPLG